MTTSNYGKRAVYGAGQKTDKGLHTQMKKKTNTIQARGAKQPFRLVMNSDATVAEPMLTMPQAIRYTGRSYGMLYKAATNGTLECQQAGPGCVMFFGLGAVNAYMARTKTGVLPSKSALPTRGKK